jgi:cytochrome c oxidase subunit I
MLKKTTILLLLAIFLNAIVFICVGAYRMIELHLNPFISLVGLFFFLLISIPLTIISVKWLVKQYNVRHLFSPAAVFLTGSFIFLTGDIINKCIFSPSTLDIIVHDTYFVIANTQLMIFFALIFLAFSYVYFMYPRKIGRMMNAPLTYTHFVITLVAAYILCLPMHYAGLAGMPRRYVDYNSWMNNYNSWINFYQSGYINGKILISILLLLFAQLLFLFNAIYSAFRGAKWRPIQ